MGDLSHEDWRAASVAGGRQPDPSERVVGSPKHGWKCPRAWVAVAVLAFVVGRRSASVHPLDRVIESVLPDFGPEQEIDPHAVLKVDQDRFAELAQAWNRYLVEHDGDLPDDPYRILFYSGRMKDVSELRAYDFLPDLPPRFNPNLKKNGRWVVFARNYSDTAEQWQCYADGMWARVKLPAGAVVAPVGAGMPFDPRETLREAGYPIESWKSAADRGAWLLRNKGRLVWDESWKMYVVGPAPATPPTTVRAGHLESTNSESAAQR